MVLTEKELAHARWVADRGDKTLRLEYDINSSDTVVDLGGFEGQWASDVFSRYLCTVHVVEPVTQYAESIAHRFERNKNIRLHQCALGASHGELRLSVSGDASSAFKEAEAAESAKVVPFTEWMTDQGIEHIVLLKVNIEGGEYDLLDHLISSGCIRKITNIQVQFHDFVQDADARMAQIQAGLSRTHVRTYHYPYVWENWRLLGAD
uniref:Putative methyltransferase n=1 Tax=viral metagenome TaxID=1070528 RepID=A0A6M3XC74_9ZZZZ